MNDEQDVLLLHGGQRKEAVEMPVLVGMRNGLSREILAGAGGKGLKGKSVKGAVT